MANFSTTLKPNGELKLKIDINLKMEGLKTILKPNRDLKPNWELFKANLGINL